MAFQRFRGLESLKTGREQMRSKNFLASALALILLMPAPLFAEDPPPFPVFSAKRVGLPAGRAGSRITIKIEPQPDPPIIAETPQPEGRRSEKVDQVLPFAWFWSDVSPSIDAASPERLRQALNALRSQKDFIPPRFEDMRRITDSFGRDILMATLDTKVSPALVAAVIHVESGGRIDAVSRVGATGLMQLMPATAERFGVSDSTSAQENIRGGVAYLDWLLSEFKHDPVLSLAGYNAGENAVKRNRGVPPYAETRGYVPKVLAAWSVAATLCKTPPVSVTDGCVFIER